AGRRGAYLHWLGKQAVLAVGVIPDCGPIPGQATTDRRRPWRHRSNTPQLCAHHSDGRLYGQACGPPSDLIFSTLRDIGTNPNCPSSRSDRKAANGRAGTLPATRDIMMHQPPPDESDPNRPSPGATSSDPA